MPDDLASLEPTLKRTARALLDADVPFGLGGGLGLWAVGGPQYLGDLDVALKAEDAGRALEALKAAGLEEEEANEGWLLKARDEDVDVDLIFHPTGVAIDDAVLARTRQVDVLGMMMPVLALEDIFTTKILAMNERHLDYDGVLPFARALREQVDWDEVRERTEHSPFARAFFVIVEGLGVVPAGRDDRPGA